MESLSLPGSHFAEFGLKTAHQPDHTQTTSTSGRDSRIRAIQWSRLGAPKAITAAAHKLARIICHLVRYGVAYVKETEEAYAEQVRQRLEKQLRRRARELGYELRPVEPPVSPSVGEPATA